MFAKYISIPYWKGGKLANTKHWGGTETKGVPPCSYQPNTRWHDIYIIISDIIKIWINPPTRSNHLLDGVLDLINSRSPGGLDYQRCVCLLFFLACSRWWLRVMGSRNLKTLVLSGAEVKFHLLPLSSCPCELSEAPLQDQLFKHGSWPALSVWPQDWACCVYQCVCESYIWAHQRSHKQRGPNTIICVHKEGNRLPTSCNDSSTSCHRRWFVGVLRHRVCPTDSFNYATLSIHTAAWACNIPHRGQWIQLPVETCKHLNQDTPTWVSVHVFSAIVWDVRPALWLL